jgi:putative Holliday junction resolvase
VPESGRILALDPGERRVGLAISDPLGITAQGLDTFDRRTGSLLEHLRLLVARLGVVEVVVGHPLSMSGARSRTTLAAERLARDIESQLGLPVTLWDERLSSAEARRVTAGSGARKGATDRVAAVLILQTYLDSRSS